MNIQKLTLKDIDIASGTGFIKQYSVSESYPLHTHDFFEVFFVCKGQAIHVINGESQMLTRGSYVFIRPQDTHRYEVFNHFEFEFISMGIPIAEIKAAYEWLDMNPSSLINAALPPHIIWGGYELLSIEKSLMKIQNKQTGEERHQYFRAILPQLLYYFTKTNDFNHENVVLPLWLIELVKRMSKVENFTEGLSKMIKLANYSQEHLTREFKKYLHLSPTEFINSKRMEYATELLIEGKYEIGDICYKCGFSNMSHFYRLFRKQYNNTPKQFVENNRDSNNKVL